MRGWRIALGAVVLPLAVAQPAAVVFAPSDVAGWRSQSFVGETQYRLGEVDGLPGLRAESHGSASGRVWEGAVDLTATPYLYWRWRVEQMPQGIDERSRAGDDFAARLYVVVSGGLAFWRTRTLVYVWSGSQAPGASWDNPYTANARMLALRGGVAETGAWREERRDLRRDLREAFGEDVRSIDAIAIMTDTDNSGQRAVAWYGDIALRPD